MRWLVALTLCTGCMSDPPRPDCSAPRRLAINTDSDESAPWLSEDRLELLFSSDRDSSFDLYRSTRASIDEDFVSARPVEGTLLNTASFHESHAFPTDDRTLWFTSNRTGGPFQLYRATRPRADAEFDTIEPVLAVGNAWRPSFTSDGLTLYFYRVGNGTTLFRATRASRDTLVFSAAEMIELDGTSFIESPWITGDDSQLLYTTMIGTEQRLVSAVREGAGFGPATPIALADGAAMGDVDADPALHSGGLTLAFASDRSATDTRRDIYLACE